MKTLTLYCVLLVLLVGCGGPSGPPATSTTDASTVEAGAAPHFPSSIYVPPGSSSPTGAAGGDLSGTYPNPGVAKANGASVPAAGALTAGNVLQVTGASTLGYAPVNLGGGANFVSGSLPTANQVAQSMAGDVTGTTAASVVARVNGASIPAAGALATGNGPYVSGASALTYSALNLAGGSGWVTGLLPAGNQAAQTCSGDVTGNTGATVVTKFTGSAGVFAGANSTILQLNDGSAHTAAAGVIRVPNNTTINARNNANGADIVFASTNTSDKIFLGDQNNAGGLEISGGSNVQIDTGTNAFANINIIAGGTSGIVTLTSAAGSISLSTPTTQFASNQVNPNFRVTPNASTSSTNGSAGTGMTVSAQAGQAATGASHNGGNGGDLTITGSPGGTSGSATAGLGGKVFLGSGQRLQQITISASTYTVDTNSTTSDFLIFTNSGSNAITITLPAPSAGRYLCFKDKAGAAATHNVTISHNAAETIDGANTLVFAKNFDAACLVSDATNWAILSEFSSTIVP